MEEFYKAVAPITFFIAIALPQVLGILVHFRMKRFPRLAYATGFVITTVLSFYLLILTLSPPPPPPGTYVCGLGAMATVMLTLFFTVIQMTISLIAQYIFYRKFRT